MNRKINNYRVAWTFGIDLDSSVTFWKVLGSNPGLNCKMTKDVKSCNYYCYVRYETLDILSWLKTGATYYHAQFGLANMPIKGKVVFNC